MRTDRAQNTVTWLNSSLAVPRPSNLSSLLLVRARHLQTQQRSFANVKGLLSPGVIAQVQPKFIANRDVYEAREKKAKLYSWQAVSFVTPLSLVLPLIVPFQFVFAEIIAEIVRSRLTPDGGASHTDTSFLHRCSRTSSYAPSSTGFAGTPSSGSLSKRMLLDRFSSRSASFYVLHLFSERKLTIVFFF